MILPLHEYEPPLALKSLFGREAPLEIEIGVGKGRFLRERAAAFPEHNFLGIEKTRKWLRHAAVRLEKAGLENIRLFETYAEPFLARYLPDQSVTVYHIYFPDPWPKKRHHKRRIIQPTLIEECMRTLAPGGEIFVATDHESYFEAIRACFSLFQGKGLDFDSSASPQEQMSNFQAKYVAEGRKLMFARASCRPMESKFDPMHTTG